MKRSDKIIRENGIQEGISWERQKTIENNVLLKYIVDHSVPIMWRWIFVMMGLIVGLYAKSFTSILGG